MKQRFFRTAWKELLIYLILYYSVRVFYLKGIDLIDDDEDDRLKMRRKQLQIYSGIYFWISGMFETFCRQCDSYTRLIPLTFLLGFYVSNVVARWWRQFETLYWPEDILSVLCTVLHQHDEKSKRRRHTIARYLNLANALAWYTLSKVLNQRLSFCSGEISLQKSVFVFHLFIVL